MSDFNTQIVEEFRANDGVVGGMFEGAALLLLNHTGRKSGKSFVAPLVYFTDNERLVIVASKGGAPENPEWYHNLNSTPDITVEIGAETKSVRASEIVGAERDRIFADIAAKAPGFGEYQKNTSRIIPLFYLDVAP